MSQIILSGANENAQLRRLEFFITLDFIDEISYVKKYCLSNTILSKIEELSELLDLKIEQREFSESSDLFKIDML
jgi:hypothetical protein